MNLLTIGLIGAGLYLFTQQNKNINSNLKSNWPYPVKTIASNKIFTIYRSKNSDKSKPIVFIFINNAKEIAKYIASDLGEIYFIESNNWLQEVNIQWHLSNTEIKLPPHSIFFDTIKKDDNRFQFSYKQIIDSILDNIVKSKDRKIIIIGYNQGAIITSGLPDPVFCIKNNNGTSCGEISTKIISIDGVLSDSYDLTYMNHGNYYKSERKIIYGSKNSNITQSQLDKYINRIDELKLNVEVIELENIENSLDEIGPKIKQLILE